MNLEPERKHSHRDNIFSAAGIADHELVVLGETANINVCGQPHRIGCFPYKKDGEFKVRFSPILRTEENFQLTEKLDSECGVLEGILNADHDSAASFNKAVSDWANESAKRYGFPGVLMRPAKLFNPEASRSSMSEHPESCKQIPAFELESEAGYLARMEVIGAKLRHSTASESDFFLLQEIETDHDQGSSAGLAKLMEGLGRGELKAVYPSLPKAGKGAAAVTLYDGNKYTEVTDTQVVKVANTIRYKLLSAFDMDEKVKCNVVALQPNGSDKLKFVANIHADYAVKPVIDPYQKINSLLDTVPGLVVGGDFNLQLASAELMNAATYGGFGFQMATRPTPETRTPTMDAVFSSPGLVESQALDGILEEL